MFFNNYMLISGMAMSCMFRPKEWYQTNHLACGKILVLRATNVMLLPKRYQQTPQVDFPLFRLLYKWCVSLWPNCHLVFFIESFCVNSMLSLWLPLAQLWAPFSSLWLPLAALGVPLDVLWDPFGRFRAPIGSLWGIFWNLFKIGHHFPSTKADITVHVHKN